MRYVNSHGRIAWKATPQLRNYRWTFSLMPRPILRISDCVGREPSPIPFSTEALQANLLRLQNEWETIQASRDRNAIYQYLTVVFELVTWWVKEGKAVNRAYRALHLRGRNSVREPEPFAAVIFARPIQTRSATGRGASGPVCCDTPPSTRT